jgi:hypothetical protein
VYFPDPAGQLKACLTWVTGDVTGYFGRRSVACRISYVAFRYTGRVGIASFVWHAKYSNLLLSVLVVGDQRGIGEERGMLARGWRSARRLRWDIGHGLMVLKVVRM